MTDRRNRTYLLTPETIARVDAAADAHRIWHSWLVELLLQHALTDLEAGRLEVVKIPVKYDVTMLRKG